MESAVMLCVQKLDTDNQTHSVQNIRSPALQKSEEGECRMNGIMCLAYVVQSTATGNCIWSLPWVYMYICYS